jgi:hypothetical protein
MGLARAGNCFFEGSTHFLHFEVIQNNVDVRDD